MSEFKGTGADWASNGAKGKNVAEGNDYHTT
jgi:hypothetical protein